jgi:hypothetical protein
VRQLRPSGRACRQLMEEEGRIAPAAAGVEHGRGGRGSSVGSGIRANPAPAESKLVAGRLR